MVKPADDAGKRKQKRRSREPRLIIPSQGMDHVFLVIVAVLLAFGILMMFSASSMEGLLESGNDGYKYLRVQATSAAIGGVIMIFLSMIDYHLFLNSKVVLLGYLAVVVLLSYTTLRGVGQAEAIRWIRIGSYNFQPSEVAKPVLIVVLSFLAVRSGGEYKIGRFSIKGVPMLIAMAPICVNMVFQRHISGLLIMCAIFACVVVMSGISWRDIIAMGLVLGLAAIVMIFVFSLTRENGLSYILTRLSSMSSTDDGQLTDENWQIMQSLIAMGSGGWFGLGLGASRQKYLWLPEAQNDFIIPIIVEELGYIGGIAVVILFVLFMIRGFRIAKTAPDKFGTLIVTGIVFQIGFQAILNIGVACNAFPNTGVSLPFFSYGGSALLVQLAEMGVVLSVSRQCTDI